MKNLFDYATKELSQDAFLRWLFENYDCENEEVVKICKKVFNAFTKDSLDFSKIEDLKTTAQWNKIDISVWFKCEGNDYLIVIEDKTTSEEHKQLDNYNEKINAHCNWLVKVGEKPIEKVYKIFYKTAKISNEEKERIDKAGWNIFDIDSIYNLFLNDNSTFNDVLDDYVAYVYKLYSAYSTHEKPKENNTNIDFVKWESYFNNSIVPYLNKNGYQVGVWKAGQYPYICLVIKKLGFSEKSPYLEIRSRDCLEDNFVARILLYGVERDAKKFSILKENIKNYTSFICQNYKQQIGETPKELKATTDEEFITWVEKFAKEFLIVMKDWSL